MVRCLAYNQRFLKVLSDLSNSTLKNLNNCSQLSNSMFIYDIHNKRYFSRLDCVLLYFMDVSNTSLGLSFYNRQMDIKYIALP